MLPSQGNDTSVRQRPVVVSQWGLWVSGSNRLQAESQELRFGLQYMVEDCRSFLVDDSMKEAADCFQDKLKPSVLSGWWVPR